MIKRILFSFVLLMSIVYASHSEVGRPFGVVGEVGFSAFPGNHDFQSLGDLMLGIAVKTGMTESYAYYLHVSYKKFFYSAKLLDKNYNVNFETAEIGFELSSLSDSDFFIMPALSFVLGNNVSLIGGYLGMDFLRGGSVSIFIKTGLMFPTRDFDGSVMISGTLGLRLSMEDLK